jgi:hypothetical protein
MNWAAWWTEHRDLVLGIVIGGAISLLINWFFFRMGKKPKRLSWEVMRRERMDNVVTPTPGYEDEEVVDRCWFLVRVGNTGKDDIVAEDFPAPMSIDFGTRPLQGSGNVRARSNPDVNDPLRFDTGSSNRFDFKPTLLNPGEWLDFQFVAEGDMTPPTITARFAGQSSPISEMRRLGSYPVFFFVIWLLIAITFTIILAVEYFIVEVEPSSFRLQLISAISTLIVFTIIIVVQNWRERSPWRKMEKQPDESPVDSESS